MAEGRRAPPGGIPELLDFVEEHLGPLEFDFRNKLHAPLSWLGGPKLRYGEAKRLMLELMKDSSTHLYADLAQQSYVGSHADAATVLLAESYFNVHRDRSVISEPVTLRGPRYKHDTSADVSAEEREQLSEQLRRRSAFPNA